MDLALCPLGPVPGAVAGYPFPFETLRPGAQALQTFEERGLGSRVLPDNGRGPFAGFEVAGSTGGAFFAGPDPSEDPSDQRRRVET